MVAKRPCSATRGRSKNVMFGDATSAFAPNGETSIEKWHASAAPRGPEPGVPAPRAEQQELQKEMQIHVGHLVAACSSVLGTLTLRHGGWVYWWQTAGPLVTIAQCVTAAVSIHVLSRNLVLLRRAVDEKAVRERLGRYSTWRRASRASPSNTAPPSWPLKSPAMKPGTRSIGRQRRG